MEKTPTHELLDKDFVQAEQFDDEEAKTALIKGDKKTFQAWKDQVYQEAVKNPSGIGTILAEIRIAKVEQAAGLDADAKLRLDSIAVAARGHIQEIEKFNTEGSTAAAQELKLWRDTLEGIELLKKQFGLS